MSRTRYSISVLVTAIISTTVSFPASAGITISFGNPGYSYNRWNHNPGIRYYYSGPTGYLANGSYLYRSPARYRSYNYNRPLPSTHVYGYYPYNSYYGYRNQKPPAGTNRYGKAYKRGYAEGFDDGFQSRHHNRHNQYDGKARKRY